MKSVGHDIPKRGTRIALFADTRAFEWRIRKAEKRLRYVVTLSYKRGTKA